METRTLGKTGLKVGVIGLGTEHLIEDRTNMDAVIGMGVESGANYVDLVGNDPSGAFAEYWQAIGPAIRRHRERLVLALHWGFIFHEPIDGCQRSFDEALSLVGNGYTDIAMVSMVDTESLWQDWAREGIERLSQYQRDGRIGFIGVSGHNATVAVTAVESGLVDVIMFPVNLYQHHADPERQALLRACAKHRVGFVAMKPYYGGRLLRTRKQDRGISTTRCLHYVLSQQVHCVVPGPRDAEQFDETLAYLRSSHDDRAYEPLQAELRERLRGQCVLCRHCLPCPAGIPIPRIIDYLEWSEYYGPSHQQLAREWYASLEAKGSDCTECEVCLERCPFDVDVIGKMHRAAEVFERSG